MMRTDETVTENQYHDALQRADAAVELYDQMKGKYDEITKELQQTRQLLDQALEVKAAGPDWQEYHEKDRTIPSHVPLCIVANGAAHLAVREYYRSGQYVWRFDDGSMVTGVTHWARLPLPIGLS